MKVRRFLLTALFLLALSVAILTGVGTEAPFKTTAELWPEAEPPVIEVTAVDYAFQAPDSIPSGWVTFRMENQGEESHYFQLDRLPDGRTFADFRRAFITPHDSLRQLLRAGEIDTAAFEKAVDRIEPDWVAEGVFENQGGGMPLLTPGRTAQATIKLEPGTYAMACVLESPNGRLHVHQGMVRPIVVRRASTGASPPEPDVTMRSAGSEITVEGSFQGGPQTVAFHVEEPPEGTEEPHSYAFLARLEPGVDADEVAQWDYEHPPPAEFLGGFEYVPTGQTAYTRIDLAPGRYAWVLPGENKTVKVFTVE